MKKNLLEFETETESGEVKRYSIGTLKDVKEAYKHFTNLEANEFTKAFTKLLIDVINKEESKPQKKELGTYKKSGHLTDQMLRYKHPKEDKQPFLLDSLNKDTLEAIKGYRIELSQVVEGIKLTNSETKLIDCFCKLLQKNNGTLSHALIEYVGREEAIAPYLTFTPYELTVEYKGGAPISGKDVENVKKVLTDLDNKIFLIKYTEQIKGNKGEWIKQEIESLRKLVHIDKVTLSSGVGAVENYKETSYRILLHPIFLRQIDSKFILYPMDISKRTIIASGSQNVPEITLRLRDYLLRELSSKHYFPEINLENLYFLLAEKWMRESRKGKVKQYTDKALQTVKALGLLLSYKIEIDSKGGEKIVFELKKGWR